MTTERIERARKPVKCPRCGFTPVATILYGMPRFDDELEKQMEAKKIVLGGCCIGADDPVWHCTECELEIYRKAK